MKSAALSPVFFELAVLGNSNSDIAQALFVTRSTVEKHLGHAYTKLAITWRSELAAVFPELG
jgi:DNA-binding NarL/FixJ family response regulator